MSENPLPTDPEREAGSPAEAHPHDPFSASRASAEPGASSEPGARQESADPYAYGSAEQEAPSFGAQPNPGAQQNPGAQPHTTPAGDWSNTPPAGTPGVSDEPMTGQPLTDGDAKQWAMFAQLSVVIGHFMAVLGWLGPLIIYLMYKDRNRFVRFHAAEALNGAIAVLLANIVLGVVFTIFTIITLGLGSFSFALLGALPVVQMVFAIIGALKANDRQWWAYPLNLRFVR